MGWFITAALAVVLGLAIAYLFPDLARGLLNGFNRLKYALLAVVGIFVAFYFLTSGVWFLVLIGFFAAMLATWQFLFNDPVGMF